MPQFYGVTSRGLGSVLEAELKELGLKVQSTDDSGVHFESNWEGCYLANLNLKSANRVLLPVLDFPAYQNDELYQNIFKKHDFTKYFSVDQTFRVDAKVRDSSFQDQRFVALKVKDAIVDQFRERFDSRPGIDKDNPHVRIQVRVVKNQFSVAVDTTGEDLSKRGYRLEQGAAPLREHLASGLLQMTGWAGRDEPLVDLMCGSGTFLIEAAELKSRVAPGLDRPRFAFKNFQSFQAKAWERALEKTAALEREIELPPIFGFDREGVMIRYSRANIERAGLSEFIQVQRKSLIDHGPFEGPTGTIVINPPYAERMLDLDQAKDLYRDLGFTLKNSFPGWTAWILSGNPELTAELGLKASEKHRVFNGSIDCRWVKYEIRNNH